MNRNFDIIKALIVANVVVAGITFLVPDMEEKMFNLLALYFPANEHFNYWQFVTSIFMHGGLMHLVLNMYGLWAFGSPLLEKWGQNRFLVFYFVVGIGANLIYTGVNYYQFHQLYEKLASAGVSVDAVQAILKTGNYDTTILEAISKEELTNLYQLFISPAVGASGAIYGVLVAFAMAYPNAKLALIFLPIPIAAKYFVPVLILTDLFSGVTGFSIFGDGVAHFAHVGGALVGFLVLIFWGKLKKEEYQEEY